MNNQLFINCESLKVMESFEEKSFDLIFLDPPYYSKNQIFFGYNSNFDRENYEKYISKILENSKRLLGNSGILCCLLRGEFNQEFKIDLLCSQLFDYSKKISLETPHMKPGKGHTEENDDLIFYYNDSNVEFKEIYELVNKTFFNLKDDNGWYRIKNLMLRNLRNTKAWKDFIPDENFGWIYSNDKLDNLYANNRILIKNEKPYLKEYWHESKQLKGNVWKNNCRIPLSGISEENINNIFQIIPDNVKNVFCPFDRTGLFSLCCSKTDLNWSSVKLENSQFKNVFEYIDVEKYEIIKSVTPKMIEYKDEIITSIGKVKNLSESIRKLKTDIELIKNSIGLEVSDDDEVKVELIINKIHEKIAEAIPSNSLQSIMPEAESWINPYWEKLETESKTFIPLGILLTNQYLEQENIDMSPVMIEYCKALEKELFKKLFYGYIQFSIEKNIDFENEFPESFNKELDEKAYSNTNLFACFMRASVTENKDKPEEWKFELGKMKFVLTMALAKKPKFSIIKNFRNYLDLICSSDFFTIGFLNDFQKIVDFRNKCAHPNIVPKDTSVEVKELIRQKLICLLKYRN